MKTTFDQHFFDQVRAQGEKRLAQIDIQITQLEDERATVRRVLKTFNGDRGKRHMSLDARRRIANAQRARWKKLRSSR